MARFDILLIVLTTWCVGLVGALAYTLFAPCRDGPKVEGAWAYRASAFGCLSVWNDLPGGAFALRRRPLRHQA